jgi:tetratricopeptide (TPR) repeat protein
MRALRISPILFLLCAALFCACSKKSAFTEKNAPLHFNELRAVEALMETDPVKAMDSISGLAATLSESSVTPLDDIEMQLRIVQAQYKNRCLTEQSLDLSPIVAFYDSLAVVYPDDADLHYLLANAYYYKGVQCAFANDDVAAFTQYLEALDVMRRREDWTNHPYAERFIALTYTRLSEILYRYGFHNAAFETCQKASSYYESEPDKAAMLRFEAAIYQSQKQYDMAMARLQEAQKLSKVDEDAFQLVLGAKFYDIQQYDSAVPHLEQAFQTGDRFARVDAAAKLSEIYRNKGMADVELAYTRFYVENSMRETQMASKKIEIGYLYDNFNHSQSEPVVAKKSDRTSLWVLLLLLLLSVAFMAYIIVRNRKRISHIENKISTIEQKHEQENADKDHEIEQMAQQLSDTREQLQANRAGFDEAWKAFTTSDVVTKIRHSVEGKDIMIKSVGVYPKLKLKEMDYINLVQEANRCFPDFSSCFLKDYPDLNIADLRHCCLGLLGMNDAEIAVLEGISYSGANRRTNKILSILHSGESLESAVINYLKKDVKH